MVAGVRVNTDNDNKSGLDTIIKRFVSEPKQKYVYKENVARKAFVDKSVQKLVNDSIIEGYFPKENLVKDMAIKRINKSLCIILLS